MTPEQGMGRIEPRELVTPDGARFLVRTAEPGDAPGLVRFEEELFETNPFKVTERGENDRDEAKEREWVLEHAGNPGFLMLVAVAGPPAEVLGRISFRSGNRRKMAHHGTFGISVRQKWRGRGVGTALIAAMLDWAAAHPSLERVTLGVFAENRGARRLYRRLGFVKEGRSPLHFKLGPGRYCDDITMSIFVKPGLAPPPFRTWPAPERSGSPAASYTGP